MLKKRPRPIFVTIFNFILIFIFLFYINNYVLNNRVIKAGEAKLKFKYEYLKENLGYIFIFYINNSSKNSIIYPLPQRVKFYIKKSKGPLIWEKEVTKPTTPVNISVTNGQIRIPGLKLINYVYLYESCKEVRLDPDSYELGVKVSITTNDYDLYLPLYTKEKKGFHKLFR